MNKTYKVSEAVVFRAIEGETVVIQSERGAVYYYSESTESFLRFFAEGSSLAEFIQSHELQGKTTEIEALSEFMESLVSAKILESASQSVPFPGPLPKYRRPTLVREDERQFDEIMGVTASP